MRRVFRSKDAADRSAEKLRQMGYQHVKKTSLSQTEYVVSWEGKARKRR